MQDERDDRDERERTFGALVDVIFDELKAQLARAEATEATLDPEEIGSISVMIADELVRGFEIRRLPLSDR
jgi:hypothetical protein